MGSYKFAWDARESTRDADGAMDKWENSRGTNLGKWGERVYMCMRETALQKEGRPRGARGQADLILWSAKQTTMPMRKENTKRGEGTQLSVGSLLHGACTKMAGHWCGSSRAMACKREGHAGVGVDV